MKCKTLLICAAILASAVLGDYYNIKDRLIEPLKYRNVKVDPGCYQNPFQLEKKYYINEEGNLEVYIGNKDEWYKVDQDLRVNERSLTEMVKEEGSKIRPYIKKKIEDLKEWYENYKN